MNYLGNESDKTVGMNEEIVITTGNSSRPFHFRTALREGMHDGTRELSKYAFIGVTVLVVGYVFTNKQQRKRLMRRFL